MGREAGRGIGIIGRGCGYGRLGEGCYGYGRLGEV
jgi:hypothetical protein